MRPVWESRKRRPRFILPVIQSASMSACSFQAAKASNSFFPCPMGSWMSRSAAQSPGIGSLHPKGLNWRPYFPDMYPACHAKVWVSESCSRSTIPNIRTAISCLPSNGLSANTGFTLRLSVTSSTMPQTGCILTLPVTGLKSLMKWRTRRRKPRYLSPPLPFSHYT